MYEKLFLLIAIVISSACQNRKPLQHQALLVDSQVHEEIIRYKEFHPVKTRKSDFLSNVAQVIGLPSIDSSTGKYLRIWLWGNEEKYAINIFGDSMFQEASISSFNSRFFEETEVIIIHKIWNIHQPKNGWEEVNRLIDQKKILLLSDGEFQPYSKGVSLTGGAWVQFELFTGGKYRYYEYFEPAYFRKVDVNSGYVYAFLKNLREEFSVDFFRESNTFVLDSIRH